MAKSSSSTTSSARKIASEGKNVRDRVRDLTVRTIRDRSVGLKDLSKVVDQVLDGAKQGVHEHFFYPNYTSIHRVAAARSGERSVVTINETSHLRNTGLPMGLFQKG